jgi:hypothetical protein
MEYGVQRSSSNLHNFNSARNDSGCFCSRSQSHVVEGNSLRGQESVANQVAYMELVTFVA